MSKKWYGSIDNRIEENKMHVDEIKVGTPVTMYLWSDRNAYEVIGVETQKKVTIREFDAIHTGGAYENKWELKSNEKNPSIKIAKRGNYWYQVAEVTPEEAEQIKASEDMQAQISCALNGFNLDEIIETGKTKRKYTRVNVSFGTADYYYDYEF